jgi:ribulose-5-phosphate 4-epimerase/fuculose-1-phosphate aldolase
MDNRQKSKEIERICRLIDQKGMVSGSGGNISCRTGDSILITPSGCTLGEVSSDRLIRVKLDGTILGDYPMGVKPSKEISMHLKCYAANPNVMAIVHVHSVYSVALSCLKNKDYSNCVPIYTPGYGARIGKLHVISYCLPGSSELADMVGAVIAKHNSVLLANHGVVAAGSSLREAMNLVEEIEENAKIHFVLKGQGNTLNDEQLEGLKRYI